MIGDDPVDLFRHPAVERTQACFNMRNRDVKFCSGQRAGQRRVGVTVDEHEIGLLLQEHILHPHQDLTGLFPVRPGSHAKVVIRRGIASSSKNISDISGS